MVSGVDTPSPAQNPLIEASTNVALINQARQGAILNSSALVVGKQFQAEVVATLTDGTYIVKVADVAARMQLPNSPEVGSKLSLTLLSTSPRATFLLNPPTGGETAAAPTTTLATLGNSVKQLIDEFSQAATGKPATGPTTTSASGLYLQPGSNVAATTNTTAQPRLITISPGLPDSAPATLSSAGKLVNQLIQNTPQQSSIVNVSKVPLVTTPDVSVNTMMKGLQSGVATSGMFYESHVLQWAEGSLPATELMKEPQAKFPIPPPTSNNVPTPGNQPAASQVSAADLVKINTPQAGSAAPASSTGTTAAASEPVITLPKGATPLIQQQLQTMEQQRFVWQGEVWPGQTMNWEIAQDTSQQSGRQQEPSWQSAVHFELPQLGSISAQLQLTGTHLKLNISTADATSALMLKNHVSDLASALDLAGTQLDAISIKARTAS